MKIHVLVDNHASRDYSAEWGLSFFIESSKNLLFDFGSSDLYLKNAKKLGLDISTVDTIILSHGHWDHGNGLEYLSNKRLICHPEAFSRRYSKNGEFIGIPFDIKEAKEKYELVLTREPYMIDENTIFLGQIPRLVDFEAKNSTSFKEDGSMDFIMDDSAIVYKTEKGLVIISGCAHSGICNIIEYAKQVSGVNNIYAVLGGFHLKENNELTKRTIDYLRKLNIERISASHCTGFDTLVQFANVFNSKPFTSGTTIEL